MTAWNFGTVLIGIMAVIIVALIGFIYCSLIQQKIHLANTLIDKPALVANAQGIFAWIDAKLHGWKTVILAAIAGLAQVLGSLPADVTAGWKELPWASVVDAKLANWITIACALLIPLTHAYGLAKAAVTPPVDPGA